MKIIDLFFKDSSKWIRQIIINSCSLQLGIPLHLYERKPKLVTNNENLSDCFVQIENILSANIHQFDWLRKTSLSEDWNCSFDRYDFNSHWLTDYGNPDPYMDIVQNLPYTFRKWLKLYFFYNLSLSDYIPKVKINYFLENFFGKIWLWGIIPLNENYYIVSDYVWNRPEKANDSYFEKKVVKPVIDKLENIFSINLENVVSAHKSNLVQPITKFIFKKQLSFAKNVLDDIFDTSITLCQNGNINNESFLKLKKGIKSFNSYVIDGSFNLNSSYTYAAKAAYISILLKNNNLEIKKFKKSENLSDKFIENTEYNKLNKIKKINPEAFFYLYETINLL